MRREQKSMMLKRVGCSCAATCAGGGGGGLREHGEAIEVVALPAASAREFSLDERLGRSTGLMFGLAWAGEQLARNGGSLLPVERAP